MEALYVPFISALLALLLSIIYEYVISHMKKLETHNKRLLWGGIIFLLLSIVIMFAWPDFITNRIMFGTVNPQMVDTSNGNGLYSSSEVGARGDAFGGTVGPIIAWLAAIITFAAFWVQYRANEQQKKDLQIERFENRFFKFIDYHRENVDTMNYRDPRKDNTVPAEYIEGNRIFRLIYIDFKRLLPKYLATLGKKELSNEDLKEGINVVYNCIFFGAGNETIDILKTKFPKLNIEFGRFRRGAKYNERIRFYGGHARRLGHYFRNMYQAVKYVDEQKFLSEKQKYEYVTILRAQMSVYEQAVFFFNSLSDLGAAWEWEYYENDYKEIDKEKVFKRLWVTKYDMIRNILNNDGIVFANINVHDFYPLLNLERDNEFAQGGELPFEVNRKPICRYCFNKKYIGYQDDDAEHKIKTTITDVSTINCNEPDCETRKIVNSK